MKKLLLLIAFLGVFGGAFADGDSGYHQKETTDYVSISDLTVVPGSTDTYKMMVNLNGSQIYTAFEMGIELPSGLEPVMVKDKEGNLKPKINLWKGANTIFPYTEDEDTGDKDFTHTLARSYGMVGPNIIRMACISTSSESFTAESGTLVTIYLKTTPYLKPGKDEVKVTECHFTANEPYTDASGNQKVLAQQYNCPDQTLYVNVEPRSTATISVSAKHQWGSCVVPFDIPELPNGLEAYSLAGDAEDGTYAVLKRETSIEAYTPYFLYAKNGFTAEFSGSVDETKYKELVSKGELYGAIVPITINNGFVLQNQGDGAKLYSIDSSGAAFNIPAGKCFAYYYSGNTSKTIDLKFDDPTGINAVETSSKVLSDKPVYSLNGVRVGTPQPGRVYVVDGRKVLWLK